MQKLATPTWYSLFTKSIHKMNEKKDCFFTFPSHCSARIWYCACCFLAQSFPAFFSHCIHSHENKTQRFLIQTLPSLHTPPCIVSTQAPVGNSVWRYYIPAFFIVTSTDLSYLTAQQQTGNFNSFFTLAPYGRCLLNRSLWAVIAWTANTMCCLCIDASNNHSQELSKNCWELCGFRQQRLHYSPWSSFTEVHGSVSTDISGLWIGTKATPASTQILLWQFSHYSLA